MSERIAFLGSKDTVSGFIPLGVAAYAVSDHESALGAFNECLARRYAVLFMTEEIAQALEKELKAIRFNQTPAVLVVPSILGSQGLGLRRLRSLVEKAVGADILSRDEPTAQKTNARMGA